MSHGIHGKHGPPPASLNLGSPPPVRWIGNAEEEIRQEVGGGEPQSGCGAGVRGFSGFRGHSRLALVAHRKRERALFRELTARELDTKCQVPLAVRYKGEVIGEYFADMIVENRILLELKAQSRLSGADDAQVLNYLRTSRLRVGLLVNFVYPKAQIKRVVS